ncbi:hypothetical protein RDWZM_006026, partial [Blomia tropicalis]
MSSRPSRTARTAAAVASAVNEELLTMTNNKVSNTGDASTKTTKNKNKKAIAVSDTSQVPESTTSKSAQVASTSKPKITRKKIELDESAPKEQVDETPVTPKKRGVQTKAYSKPKSNSRPLVSTNVEPSEDHDVKEIE